LETPTAFTDFIKAFDQVDRMKLTELLVIREKRIPTTNEGHPKCVAPHFFLEENY
jgi:hypothetical protein